MHDQGSSRLTDNSMLGSRCLTNSSTSKKVPYNISQNSLRKQILSDLEIALHIVFLAGPSVTGVDSDAQISFDPAREAYLLGTCALSFDLKDASSSEQFFLDFCGDQIFELDVNGISIPIDTVSWTNNQISLTSLRGGMLR